MNLWRRLWRVDTWWMMGIAGLVILLRLPSLWEPHWYGDEGIYLAIGKALSAGGQLYIDIVDHKTPIIYYLVALLQTLWMLKVYLIVSVLVCVLIYWQAARLWFESRLAVVLATGAFGILVSLPRYEGTVFNGELVFLPLTLLGTYLFWRTYRRGIVVLSGRDMLTWVVVGILFGVAFLVKVPAGIELLTVLGFLLTLGLERKILMRLLLLLGLGFVLPIGFSFGWFWWQGSVEAYMFFGYAYNLWYAAAWSSDARGLAWLLSQTWLRAGLLGVYLVGIGLVLRDRRAAVLRYGLMWLGVSLFAATLSLRPYPHYLLQLVPAGCMMLGVMVSQSGRWWWGGVGLIGMLWLVSLIGISPYDTIDYYVNYLRYQRGEISWETYADWFDDRVIERYETAALLESFAGQEKTLFVWGDDPTFYSVTNMYPAGKYTAWFHAESLDDTSGELARIREGKPDVIVVIDKTMSSDLNFGEWIDRNYELFYETSWMSVYVGR